MCIVLSFFLFIYSVTKSSLPPINPVLFYYPKNKIKSKYLKKASFPNISICGHMALALSDGSVAEAQRILDLKETDFAGILKLHPSLVGATPEMAKTAYQEIRKILYTRHSFGIESVTKAKQKLEKAYNSLASQPQIDQIRARMMIHAFDADDEVQQYRCVAQYTVELEKRMKGSMMMKRSFA